jgi:hypothetical protein
MEYKIIKVKGSVITQWKDHLIVNHLTLTTLEKENHSQAKNLKTIPLRSVQRRAWELPL